LGGDQGGFRAAPFNQRIGRQRCAVNDLVDLAWINARFSTDLMPEIAEIIKSIKFLTPIIFADLS